ncbi:MAG: dihydrofolate reductase family protein [Deltaproteobacteria bacterium]|nr:dihydrofolate reductase family protein [Deltaproteobacteria bacterium]
MRDLAILIFVTLDGVMQGPSSPEEDPSGGFTQGGWAAPYWNEVMQQVEAEAMSVPYDLLLGRTTYDLFASSFENADESNLAAHRLNRAHKFVATSSATRPLEWRSATRVTGDVATEVAGLKARDGLLLQVHGSWQLIQTLLEHDLVDELRLWTFPVVLGGGKRLFAQGSTPADFKLLRTGCTPNGVTMGIYRRAP